jgi:hypothetical protein
MQVLGYTGLKPKVYKQKAKTCNLNDYKPRKQSTKSSFAEICKNKFRKYVGLKPTYAG